MVCLLELTALADEKYYAADGMLRNKIYLPATGKA